MSGYLEDCDILITDNGAAKKSERLYSLAEISAEFQNVIDTASFQAMSDYELYLKGQRKMLQDVVRYFKVLQGEDEDEDEGIE